MKSPHLANAEGTRKAETGNRKSAGSRAADRSTSFTLLLTLLVAAPFASAALPPRPAKSPAKAANAQPVPVARWTFDKEEGGAFPATGPGVPIKKSAGIEVTGGRAGNALKFGRESTGGAEIEQSLGELAGDAFTLMFWILQEKEEVSTTTYADLFDAGGREGLGLRIQQHSLIDVTQGGMWHYLATSKRFNLETGWTQIAYTFDGNMAVLYVNGEAFERKESEQGPGKPPKLGSKMVLGSNVFNGAIDDLRIYNTVLTPQQIVAAESD